ncbi:uncharacterized protein LOC119771145 [Culex quinquefasciatus]|uniref:uncharacterized protein LOC119771145 n=1 Tax=Culex quinquefasciatus TaxID=7176 RepID=UPI0018E2F4FF|nr:uncharacterized protein LOC119771145 [Culex quinquefasciatus]
MDMQALKSRRNAFMAQVSGELSVAESLKTRKPSQSEVKDRLTQLNKLAERFRETQTGIEELQEDAAAIASVYNVREEFFHKYYKAKDAYEEFLDVDSDGESTASQRTVAETSDWKQAMHLLMETQRQLLLNQSAQRAGQASNCSPNGGQVQSGLPQLNVQLPAISVPKFTGDRKKWTTFKDLYVSTIHNRDDLTDTLKMQYLYSYLDVEPKRQVARFSISEANYKLAWEALTDYYDKKRFTVFSLVREFMDQPSIASATPESLNKLVTSSDEIVQQLDTLGEEFQTRDPWLIHLVLEKLDKDTRAGWSQKVIEKENPKFDELLSFLKKRCEVLETCSAFSKKVVLDGKKEATKQVISDKKLKALHTTATNQKCAKCSKEHNMYQCEEFRRLSVQERRELVQKVRLCFNCLRPAHCAKSCTSKSSCHTPECKQRHHTLLCTSAANSERASEESGSSASVKVVPEKKEEVIASLMVELPEKKRQVLPLLPTAVVKVRKVSGGYVRARVLIDSGSQASLVTEECVRKLELPRRNGKLAVSGLGQQEVGTTRGVVTLQIASRFDEVVVIATDAYILGKLTSTIPSQRFDVANMKLLQNIPELADPDYNRPGPIDIILGSDVFLALLEGGQVKDESGQTVAQRTVLGWIVAGRYDDQAVVHSNHTIVNLHAEMDLNRTLRQFWEQEENFKPPPLTPSEQQVTEHFSSTLQRDGNGRFIVRLPFDDSKPALGDSLAAATKRLKSMERRFQQHPEFKQDYTAFLREYLELGHMEEVPADQVEKDSSKCYYLPHHAVIKADSSTTKLRVVFDASCATSTGVSLNDRLRAGPNNNADLFSVALRFRSHKVVFCADVAKMYRQVLVHPDDRDYQRIVFREEPDQPIKHYRLCTVTYGTKTAPYLAIESMRAAAKAYDDVYPQAVERIKRDFYVDDFLSGADDTNEATCLKQQVVEILSSAGFELRKWTSNNQELLQEQRTDESAPVLMKFSEQGEAVKALGIQWFPTEDVYGFKVNLPDTSFTFTKRQMISDSSKLFDPFGWLAPVLVKIKILYQQLWLFDVNWDDSLPPAVKAEWQEVRSTLHLLENMRIPRYLSPFRGRIQLHGFSDASEQAYAAVVYARSVNANGNISVVLIAAKSRVAPIKQVSLPRLELCGAWLLALLMERITEALSHLAIEHWAWTDSTIVLNWLSTHPRKWKTYVANRTAAILDYLPRSCWNHVLGKENPADLATRGLTPAELLGNPLWLGSAPWMQVDQALWKLRPVPVVDDEDLLETRVVKSLHLVAIPIRENYDEELGLLAKRSSFTLIIRTLACVNRLVRNCRTTKANRQNGELAPAELSAARAQLVRAVQHTAYAPELELLRKGKSLPTKHILSPLHPFLDEQGTMRLGGRLQNSDLPYDVKHPMILPQNHVATEMLVRELHLRNLHAGPALLTATIYQQYWIVGCQTVVRKVVHGCTRCVRLKGKTANQLMGNLPPARVLATRPFSHVGVDYAGPVKLKAACVRGVKVTKGYIAVFVCLSTKAVHLEVASDLSTNTFISVLKRFVSRRGYPVEIWSDNGTNFVGADRVLQEFVEQIQFNGKEAARFLSNLGIKWTFNPPSAPHMGGIWEAAVKSTKKHLVAELGDEAITFEDLSTILCQVEACLNSRPLCALSSNPDSVEALTPGHFLVGQPMNLVPEPNVQHLPVGRLDHWQALQRRAANIWNRWRDEYLTSLQPRNKWRTPQPNIEVDQLVLVKNDNAPPTQWELARVKEVHPDATGAVRTVTLRRGSTVYQRPIHKLCLLPRN